MNESFRHWLWRQRWIPARAKLALPPKWTQAEVDRINDHAAMRAAQFRSYVANQP